MKALTSISPYHVNNEQQSKAVKSWIDLGLEVYSFNHYKEIELLKDAYPDVTFIGTYQTMENTFNKPYVRVNAVLDWCKDQMDDHFCIVNSDIELKVNSLDNIKLEMESSIVMANRVNHNGDYIGGQYTLGIDVFFIHKKWLGAFSQTIFCFGQCFWDYWIPYSASKAGIDTTFIQQDIAYHLNHNAQYNHDQWLKCGRYFQWEQGLYNYQSSMPSDIGRMNQDVFNYIYTTGKRKTI